MTIAIWYLRWKSLSRNINWISRQFTKQASFPIIQISSDTTSDEKVIYLSAGIHGDEVSSNGGSVRMGTGSSKSISLASFCYFPCLNPWGLINNSRWDQEGVDLNRVWDNRNIRLWEKSWSGSKKWRLVWHHTWRLWPDGIYFRAFGWSSFQYGREYS